jgi:uncharacterized protein (DUF1015 family)
VAKIKPFRALRPVQEKAEQVSCVPYDVVGNNEARAFVQANPLSFLRVTRAEAEFTEFDVPSPESAFKRAKANLDEFIRSGALIKDDRPSFYIYRLEANSHRQTGLVACVSVDEYENGLIKKHEKVRPDKVGERTSHMIALRAQTGLIFLTFRDTEKTVSRIQQAAKSEPLYDFVCHDGIRHSIWKIEPTDEMETAFSEVPSLYIADGHHRIESAAQARKMLSSETLEQDADFNYVMAGIFPASELQILAYNRAVHDLNSLSTEDFLGKLRTSFIVEATTEKQPKRHGEICMYLSQGWYKLRFNVHNVREPDIIERLDVSILQDHILKPILGIDDPRTDERIEFVGGRKGPNALERLVDGGQASVAFSLFATTMEDLLEVSDQNEVMPPKSTWFEPKLKDGLLIHLI